MIGASDITSFSEVELRHSPRGDNCDRKSTRLNSSHGYISYAVFCLKKKKNRHTQPVLPLSPASATAPTLPRRPTGRSPNPPLYDTHQHTSTHLLHRIPHHPLHLPPT